MTGCPLYREPERGYATLMFEVLVYLFETYYSADTYPDQETITQNLTQAGFEDEQIHEALAWLGQLTETSSPAARSEALEGSHALRIYSRSEQAKISPDALGFVAFLETAGVLNAGLRELIIEHAMATALETVDLEDLKVIVLMVLWTREGRVDTLILDELLPDGEPRNLH